MFPTGIFCWLSQSEVWYNNNKVVQKLAPFCIPCRVLLSFLHGPLFKEQLYKSAIVNYLLSHDKFSRAVDDHISRVPLYLFLRPIK